VRGWLLVRVVIAIGVAVGGAFLSILPVLPSDWKPRAPLIALAVVLALYLGAEYSHGIAGRKETLAYRAHVGDLQGFARQSRQTVEKQTGGGWAYTAVSPMSVSPPLGPAFRKHFHHLASQIDEWNLVATGYPESFSELQRAAAAETDRLGVSTLAFASAFSNLLNGIAVGSIDPHGVIWVVENGRIDAVRNGTFSLALLPTTEAETEQLLTNLWESCLRVRDLPEVREWLRRTRRTDELWPSLRNDLASVEVMHDPPGHCPLCPK
jgi:hypothetical protein